MFAYNFPADFKSAYIPTHSVFFSASDGLAFYTPEEVLNLTGLTESHLLQHAARLRASRPFGLTMADAVAYSNTHFKHLLPPNEIPSAIGALLLLYIEAENKRPRETYLRKTPIRPVTSGSSPITDAEWRRRQRACVVQHMAHLVASGEITSVAEHRTQFAAFLASIGDYIAGDSLWYNLRTQTGADKLLVAEKESKAEAKAQREAEAKQQKAEKEAQREAEAKQQKAEAKQQKADNVAAMEAAWARSREAKAKREAEAKAQREAEAARKKRNATVAKYRANKKAGQTSQTQPQTQTQTQTQTAADHLRAAATLLQETQIQLAERLLLIANRLDGETQEST